MRLLVDFPYLTGASTLVALSLALVVVLRRHRRALLLGGALSMPYALVSWQYIPRYWDPPVTGHFVTSPEDVLFATSMGVIAWAIAIVPRSQGFAMQLDLRRAVVRYGGASLLCAGISELLRQTVLGPSSPMHAGLAGIAIVGAILIRLRPDMLARATVAAVAYAVFHLATLAAARLVWPDLTDWWTPAAQLRFTVAGLPAVEAVWAAGGGFAWPLLMAWATDVRFETPPGP